MNVVAQACAHRHIVYAYTLSACPFVIFHTGLLAVPLTRYLERGTLFLCNRNNVLNE